jgi:hypothetical protein
MFAGVMDDEARKKAELDRLADNRESAGDHGLAGDDRRYRRKQDQRHSPARESAARV